MIAFGSADERFVETAGVANLSDVFQFQWTSSESLEDKWLRWVNFDVNMTSLGHPRLLVWRMPRNDPWNNTYVLVLHKPALYCVQASIRVCE